MVSEHDIVTWFEREFGIRFKHASGDEYVSTNGCPWCGSSRGVSDRFHVWTEKQNYWCRQCDKKGFLDELTGENKVYQQLSDHEKRLIRLEREQAELRRRQEELEQRVSVLERMHSQMPVAETFFQNLANPDNGALEYWCREGMELDTIDRYKLGYCPACAMDYPDHRPSYTIPVVSNGLLWNIRHRIATDDPGSRYRPHMKGLPNVLFNADYLRDADSHAIYLLEGEKKSMVAAQIGFPNVAVMGMQGFDAAWVPRFDRFKRVVVVYDPDAWQKAVSVAKLFGNRGRVAALPDKIDDLIVKHGYTYYDIRAYLRDARSVPHD